MKTILRLMLLVVMVMSSGVIAIKFLKKCSWGEAFEIGDQFMEDLLG
ncbi:MAG: hypothetical protein J7M27_05745 [Candidatus Latescibacteria bacterium]|nr:hypothetical protein [Candidatus Latescibacterota bacterium]